MRWTLRSQILIPFVTLMFSTILVVSGLNAWLATRRTESEIEIQLQDIATTLSESTFPLGDAVLKQASGLSGVQLAISDLDGVVLYRSDQSLSDIPRSPKLQTIDSLELGKPIRIGDETYFHAVVVLDRRRFGRERSQLHLLYPETKWREARREAMVPPLLVGACAVLLVVVIGVVIAGRVTRPIRSLDKQVKAIAAGQFEEISVPSRNDELRDLADEVNRMTRMLAKYEDEVRRNERLRTLGQLGGGIAHQMRNAATGCRMALDLHARKCSLADDDEDIGVATRQLSLMERYLQRFLTLGQSSTAEPTRFAIQEVVENVMPLVSATAQHVGTKLTCQLPEQSLWIKGSQEDLEQVLVNLVLNAIEATADGEHAEVEICVVSDENGRLIVIVRDTGAGPVEETDGEIFDPLISSKPDGAGLGLSVAKEVVEYHQGTIQWRRVDDWTCFEVTLPLAKNDAE